MPTRPKVDCVHHHAVLAAPDVQAAVDFYVDRLGFDRDLVIGDPPTFAGVSLGGVQIHIVQGAPHPGDNDIYFVIGDADELHDFHAANGVTITRPPMDEDYGLRTFWIRDLNGYSIGFGHYLPPTEPKLEIERVDVPVRLEKLLAAVLQDLAVRKGISVSSTLEETLLHTFEAECPCPHTNGQMRHIQDLKKKHGVDYDSHASYRFVEKQP
jgi:catechol 2,3-dioxygenase-like lactoylglutathione lyase family enzyme